MADAANDISTDKALFTAGTARVISTCFALAAFGVAVVAGLVSDNPASTILVRALLAMVVCYPVGWCIGVVCQRVIDEQVRSHQVAHPAPDSPEGEGDNTEERAELAPAHDEEMLTV